MTVNDSPNLPKRSGPTTNKMPQDSVRQEVAGKVTEDRPPHGARSPISQERVVTFEAFKLQNPETAKVMLSQLRELTDCNDQELLSTAFNKSRMGPSTFKVENAIDWIFNQRSVETEKPRMTQNTTTIAIPVANSASNAPPNSPNSSKPDVVDLTGSPGKDDPDYLKAIKLSLEESNRTTADFGGGQISQEDQDVSRALEASLMESLTTCGPKRKRSEAYIDPRNPHERERKGMWPVGLKNVGLTCWFASVTQALFSLNVFRSLVVNYQQSPLLNLNMEQDQTGNSAENLQKHGKAEFIAELRRLFAVMLGSHRKYADPSRVLNCMAYAKLSSANKIDDDVIIDESRQQQDISEFTHFILDLFEEVLKTPEAPKSENQEEKMEEDPSNHAEKEAFQVKNYANWSVGNPIKGLFFGEMLLFGKNQGATLSKYEKFKQWPLPVNSTSSYLHDALQQSLEQENVHNELGDCPVIERWFTKLPPVLILELSRFQYNLKRNFVEKLHNQMDFPEILYMDRYMVQNKHLTTKKREEVRLMKEKLSELQERLSLYTSYGGYKHENEEESNGVLSLPTILKATLNFATTPAFSENEKLPAIGDPSVLSPLTNKSVASVMMQVDSPCPSPKMTPASSVTNLAQTETDIIPMDVESNEFLNEGLSDDKVPRDHSLCDKSKSSCEATSQTLNSLKPPAPRFISEAEMQVFKNCLPRWLREIDEDIKSLKSSINKIEKSIDEIYEEEELCKHRYQLHAIIVHEGSPDSGHYWAYIRDYKRKGWLKYNDNSITRADWETLQRDSIGVGRSKASAYSIMYIDTQQMDYIFNDGMSSECFGSDSFDFVEDGDPEDLLQNWPLDLIEFVREDNNRFQQEILEWDRGDLDVKRDQPGSLLSETDVSKAAIDKNGFCHHHAQLNSEKTKEIILSCTEHIEEYGMASALTVGVPKLIKYYQDRVALQTASLSDSNLQQRKTSVIHLPIEDVRLESLVAYMVFNDVPENSQLITLSCLEHFAHPCLKTNESVSYVNNFREQAENLLKQKQLSWTSAVRELSEWHKTYRNFRLSVHCLVDGIEAMSNSQFAAALGLFLDAHYYSLYFQEPDLENSKKSVKSAAVRRLLCLSYPEVSVPLCRQAKVDLTDEILDRIRDLIVPSITIINDGVQNNLIHSETLAEFTDEWVALFVDTHHTQKPEVADIFDQILEPGKHSKKSLRQPKNRSVVNFNVDLVLHQRYATNVAKLRELEK